MVVQTKVYDGVSVKTRTWRNIIKNLNLAELREGFFAQEEHCKWGVMVQLRGQHRIVLARFGEAQEENDNATI